MSIKQLIENDTITPHQKLYFDGIDVCVDFTGRFSNDIKTLDGLFRGPYAKIRDQDTMVDIVKTRSTMEEFVALSAIIQEVAPEFANGEYKLFGKNCISFAKKGMQSARDAIEQYRDNPVYSEEIVQYAEYLQGNHPEALQNYFDSIRNGEKQAHENKPLDEFPNTLILSNESVRANMLDSQRTCRKR